MTESLYQDIEKVKIAHLGQCPEPKGHCNRPGDIFFGFTFGLIIMGMVVSYQIYSWNKWAIEPTKWVLISV